MASIPHSLISLLLGTCLALASETGSFERTLSVSGPVDLDVRSDPGGIVITTGSAASVRVHAVIKPLYGEFDLGLAEANIRALQLNPPIEQVGNRIRIGYVRDPALLRGITMRLEIESPRASRAHAYTESGGIRIEGIDGPVETVTSSGRTEISNVAKEVNAAGRSGAMVIRGIGGHVSVRNQSGGIQALSIDGEVDAETTSGRTEISSVSGGVHSKTHSGSISIDNAKGSVVAINTSGSIDALQLAGPVHAETTSGAIRISQVRPAAIRACADSGAIKVELANRGGYTIDAQSDSGRVSGPVADKLDRGKERHRLQVQVGAGGPLVDLDTHSSRIEIN
jgi:hypothetical protein